MREAQGREGQGGCSRRGHYPVRKNGDPARVGAYWVGEDRGCKVGSAGGRRTWGLEQKAMEKRKGRR